MGRGVKGAFGFQLSAISQNNKEYCPQITQIGTDYKEQHEEPDRWQQAAAGVSAFNY